MFVCLVIAVGVLVPYFTTAQDMFISEVFNGGAGGLQYIELYNPTDTAIGLASSNYQITVAITEDGVNSIDTVMLSGGLLGPGLTHTVCANNSLQPGASMTLLDGHRSGSRVTRLVEHVRGEHCHQFLQPGQRFGGNDTVYLMNPYRTDAGYVDQNWIDTFGGMSIGQRITACGFSAAPTGFLFQRSVTVSSGNTNWTQSSGTTGSSGDCYWNNHSGSNSMSSLLTEVTVGFHVSQFPNANLRWTRAPFISSTGSPTYAIQPPSITPTQIPSIAPTTNQPTVVPTMHPSDAPTINPETSTPTSAPSFTQPTFSPSNFPTPIPSSLPSTFPSGSPSAAPTGFSLFISEIYSGGTNGLRYVEIYNPGSADVNLFEKHWVLRVLVPNDGGGDFTIRDVQLQGEPIGSGRVHTVCVDSRSAEQSTLMNYTAATSGLIITGLVSTIRESTCNQYFDTDVSFPGNEHLVLGQGITPTIVPRDVFGNGISVGDPEACGSNATASNEGFVFTRASQITEGEIDWSESSGLNGGVCSWNLNLGISNANRRLFKVSPGYHIGVIPFVISIPTSAPSTMSPSSAPTVTTIEPTSIPTSPPSTMSPSSGPTVTTIEPRTNSNILIDNAAFAGLNEPEDPIDYLIYTGLAILACVLVVVFFISCGHGHEASKASSYTLATVENQSYSSDLSSRSNPTKNSNEASVSPMHTPSKSKAVTFQHSVTAADNLHPTRSSHDEEIIVRISPGDELGLGIVGPLEGSKTDHSGCYVHDVKYGSAAEKNGELQPGMLICNINMTDTRSMSKEAVLDLLKRSTNDGQKAVMFKVKKQARSVMDGLFPTSPSSEKPTQDRAWRMESLDRKIEEEVEAHNKELDLEVGDPVSDTDSPGSRVSGLDREIESQIEHNQDLDSQNGKMISNTATPAWRMSALDREIESQIEQHNNELGIKEKHVITTVKEDTQVLKDDTKALNSSKEQNTKPKINTDREVVSSVSTPIVKSKWVHDGHGRSGTALRPFFERILKPHPDGYQASDNGKFVIHNYGKDGSNEFGMGLIYKEKLTLHQIKIDGENSVIGNTHYASFKNIDELVSTLSSRDGIAGLAKKWPILLSQGWTTHNKFESLSSRKQEVIYSSTVHTGTSETHPTKAKVEALYAEIDHSKSRKMSATRKSQWVHDGHGKGTALRDWAASVLQSHQGGFEAQDNGKFAVHVHNLGGKRGFALAVIYKERVTMHQIHISANETLIGKKNYGSFGSVDELIKALSTKEGIASLPERWPIVLTDGWTVENKFKRGSSS